MPYKQYPKAGIGNANSFLTSGNPWMTGSTEMHPATQHKIEFPKVAREIMVLNQGGTVLRVYFTHKGDVDGEAGGTSTFEGKHYLTLKASETMTFRCKAKEFYIYNTDGSIVGGYELYAELTGIESSEMYALTGSGLTTSTGDEGWYHTNFHTPA